MRLVAAAITATLLVVIFTTYDTRRLTSIVSGMEPGHAGLLAALLVANLTLVCLRFHLILRRLDVPVAFWPALRANVLSQIAGLLVLQVVGQFLGRVAFLRRHGVPAATVASITLYEKVTSLAAALAFMVGGMFVLLGHDAGPAMASTLGQVPLPQLAALLCLGIAVSLRWGALRFERRLWRWLLSWTAAGRALEVSLLTLVSQGCMVAAYVVAARELAAPLPILDLAAAGSVVMFAASLPISVSGWGVREIASVYTLGLLGVPAEQAVAISILVGFTALVCLLAVAGGVTLIRESPVPARPVAAGAEGEPAHDKAAIALLAVLSGIAVFFQLHIPVQDNLVNINLADPLALTGGAYFLFRWAVRRQWPSWRAPLVNPALAAMSASIVLAFAIGYLRFGATPWAVDNRLLGWLVILCYFFTGAVIAGQWGANGTRRVLETAAAAGGIVSLYIVLSVWLTAFGWKALRDAVLPDFQLLSPNPNAVAFQILLALIAALAAGRRVHWGAAGAMGAAIILIGSRAGWGTSALVVLLALGMGLAAPRRILPSLAVAVALLAPIFVVPYLGGGGAGSAGMPWIVHQSSDNERWYTFLGAVALWRVHPWLGAGLGAYMADQIAAFGRPLVIHNTALWILAEFGMLGFAVFGGSYAAMLRWCAAARKHAPDGSLAMAALLMLVAFGVFSMVHEVLYQRMLWLLLGGLLGLRRRTTA
ncbi:MAG TPA: lysylphosphatidylglycerol synthase domain-containing protein [Stellaceae bacterium]|nr:lysylphosphatidylglycerol synthase domain-containing protein [Stellaceae bacterium]